MAAVATTTRVTLTINAANKTISNVALARGIATITTSAAHGYIAGQKVTIAATTNTGLNGTFMILDTPSGTTFRYRLLTQLEIRGGFPALPADIASGADTGTTVGIRTVVLPNRRSYTTSGSAQTAVLTADEYARLDPALVGAAPALFTDATP
jgi:hypothetical protein